MILESTQEYRTGEAEGGATISASSTITSTTTTTTMSATEGMKGPGGSVLISAGEGVGERGVTGRFLGLVVVPGEVIVKVEVEERKGRLGGGIF